MVDFAAVTEEDLERARQDPAFRQKLLSNHLEVLLLTLNKMRSTNNAWIKPPPARSATALIWR